MKLRLSSKNYGYDSADAAFNCVGTPSFGYDASESQFTALNPGHSGGNVAMFRQFTGKERDSESGLDYFGARYYGSALGRFGSPDPSGLLAAKPGNPQSWNLYAYSMNSPLINIDPDGLDCVSATNNSGGYSIDHNSDSGASAACGKAGGTWVPGYVDESWVHYNSNNGQYQVGSVDAAFDLYQCSQKP